MKVLFMGTPDFAVPCLEALVAHGHQVVGVFTQPDKPVGRKQILTPPPVKVCAQQHDIPVYQPEKMKDGTAMELVRQMQPDVIVVVAYGKILPKDILEYPKYGCINIHGSLLPRYRGAAPIQWSVINGEKETGVTAMLMDEGLDTGDMLLKRTVAIGENETAGELFDRLKDVGAQALVETLVQLEAGNCQRTPQDDSQSCYACMLDKKLACIDFSKNAQRVHDLIRGLNSWPIAYTYCDGKKMKVYTSTVARAEGNCGTPGQVLGIKKGCGLEVACGTGSIYLKEIQMEGKKRMDIEMFLCGYCLERGHQLG